MSGRVVSDNPALNSEPALVVDDPFGVGWLIRVAPTHLREELNELKRR